VGLFLTGARGWRGRVDVAGLLLVPSGAAMVPVVSFADTRFKVPVAPCYAILAAMALVAAWERLRPPAPRPVEDLAT
jgi:asparagine N-glycosylation enzyme membrane subunit Stt3